MRISPPMPRVARRVAFATCLVVLSTACSSGSNAPTSTATSTPSTGTNTGTSGAVAAIKTNPCSVSGTLQLAVATVSKVDCSNGGTTLTVAGAGASYLILTQLANNVGPFSFVQYHARSGTPAAATSARLTNVRFAMQAATASASAAGLPARRPMSAQYAADRLMRQRGLQVMRSGAAAHTTLRMQSIRADAAAPIIPALGSVRTFHVANSMTVNTYGTSVARLAYAGANVLIYVDTLAPTGFTSDQLAAYGKLVDQTLYPIDTAAFGSPSDVDGNGRFIMVMSQVVNAMTPTSTCSSQGFVAGFFDPNDFSTTDANSNKGEVFYAIVPDPSGKFSCTHTVSDVTLDVPATFLHELQHLINYSQHVVLAQGAPLDSWLDEGLSIVGEELGSLYYENKCPPPACRTTPTQMFPDSSQGFISGFFWDAYQYALLPDTASILLEDDSDGGFAWRGGAWLLTRYMADQYGNGALRKIATGPADGLAAITAATGQNFQSLIADFGVALYTDSLPGLPRTTAPAANRFTSRNLRALWARLYATSSGSSVPSAMPLYLAPLGSDTTSYVMYPGAQAYWRLDTPAASSAVTIQFSSSAYTGLSALLKPQIVVFRLPPGQ